MAEPGKKQHRNHGIVRELAYSSAAVENSAVHNQYRYQNPRRPRQDLPPHESRALSCLHLPPQGTSPGHRPSQTGAGQLYGSGVRVCSYVEYRPRRSNSPLLEGNHTPAVAFHPLGIEYPAAPVLKVVQRYAVLLVDAVFFSNFVPGSLLLASTKPRQLLSRQAVGGDREH